MPTAVPGEWLGASLPSPAALRELIGAGPFTPLGRATLAFLYTTRRRRHGHTAIRLLGGGAVYVDRRTLASDLETLREIFVPRRTPYATDYTDALVVDIGAHKGYFGAFALLGGARGVLSYEPASENFTPLERAAASFRRRGLRWDTRNAAVGEESGSGALSLSAESWTHSLHANLPASGPARGISSEIVSIVAADHVLGEARREAAGGKLIVKIDAEGAECEICRAKSAAWQAVDELFVETHEAAPCSADDLVAVPAASGLEPAGTHRGVLHLNRPSTAR